MSLHMENCKPEHQKTYFLDFFYPCSLNIVSAMIEQKQYHKGLRMLQNLEESVKKQQWGELGHL